SPHPPTASRFGFQVRVSPRLFPKHSPSVLLSHFVSDAHRRQPHELRERRIRPTRPARQRRNEACHGTVAVPIEGA
ncbi:MAG: hypothetical protein WAK55_31940, partial [Xanthobacteraceae bacterium]